jgi:hypothetical protein
MTCVKTRKSQQTIRHTAIRDVLRDYLYRSPGARASGLITAVEVDPVAVGLQLKADYTGPAVIADFFLSSRDGRVEMFVDHTVTHPTKQSFTASQYSDSKTIDKGVALAAKRKAADKDAKYKKAFAGIKTEAGAEGRNFFPIAMETGGAMDALAVKHIRNIALNFAAPVEWLPVAEDGGSRFKDHGGRYSIFIRRLYEKIAVALQRANGRLIRDWLAMSPRWVVGPAGAPEAGGAAAAAVAVGGA